MQDDKVARQPTTPASSHRLPTISASQAFFTSNKPDDQNIAFGLPRLDALLKTRQAQGVATTTHDAPKGIERGKITEIYGPPGAGKTALCLQAAANALQAGDHVVWIDGASKFPIPRFTTILSHHDATASPLKHLTHYHTPTLAHLLALLTAPLPPHTTLVIIDALSLVVEHAYPRNIYDDYSHNKNNTNKNDNTKWLSGRRIAVINELASRLNKLAAVHNIAILVTNQVMTRVKRGEEAVVAPILGGQEWSAAMGARVVVFADFAGGKGGKRVVRFAEVVKGGSAGGGGRVVGFVVKENGVEELGDVGVEGVDLAVRIGRKRGRDEIEGPDGEDEDGSSEYGWAEDDEDPLAAAGLLLE